LCQLVVVQVGEVVISEDTAGAVLWSAFDCAVCGGLVRQPVTKAEWQVLLDSGAQLGNPLAVRPLAASVSVGPTSAPPSDRQQRRQPLAG
jgi:hypothetical protein